MGPGVHKLPGAAGPRSLSCGSGGAREWFTADGSPARCRFGQGNVDMNGGRCNCSY